MGLLSGSPEATPFLGEARAVDPSEWYDYVTKHGLNKTQDTYAAKVRANHEIDDLLESDDEALRGVGGRGEEPRGQLAKVACSIPMRTLYAARVARFDLQRITCKIACHVSKWTVVDDKRMLRIIHWHADHQIGFVGDNLAGLSLCLFCDANFGAML